MYRAPTATAALLSILVAMAAYFGGYCALLADTKLGDKDVPPHSGGWGCYRREPVYRIDSPLVAAAFWPAHQLDRVVRVKTWKAAPEP